MHGSPSRVVNSIGEHNGGLFGLCCPTRRTNRLALVCVLTKKHFCSAICWFSPCNDDRGHRRRGGGSGSRPPVPPSTAAGPPARCGGGLKPHRRDKIGVGWSEGVSNPPADAPPLWRHVAIVGGLRAASPPRAFAPSGDGGTFTNCQI